LKGKRALITGGTGGIGWAIAERLAQEGADIALCSRNGESVARALVRLKTYGVRVSGRSVDVGDATALKDWVGQVSAEFGALDIVVPNVSAGGGRADLDAWKSNFELDMMGTVHTVEASLPALERGQDASIIIISSTAALESFLGPMPYNAMKAALINYAKNLSNAFAPKNIRVNTISPGPIYVEDGVWGQAKKHNPAVFEMIKAQIPAGRMGTAAEVGAAAAFLSSPIVSFINGANIVIDGGFTKRVNF
jgi:3-oxoacyl-[acyl-carrier protein] reductase